VTRGDLIELSLWWALLLVFTDWILGRTRWEKKRGK
jgi:hypothetical protein